MMAEPQPAGSLIRNENYLSYCDLVKRAVDVNRIASDEYFRVRKSYKDIESHPVYRNRNYYDNYSKRSNRSKKRKSKQRAIAPITNHELLNEKDLKNANKAILTGELSKFKKFVKNLDIKLPEHTLYTIDKVVRDRLRESRYGIDFSEYVNLEKDEEHKYHRCHHEMLRLGKSSILIENIPHSIILADKLAKSPILPHNVVKRNPSRYEAIRKPKKDKRAKTVAKYGSCRRGMGTAKEDYADWRMRKQAYDRMSQKLISQAKDEIKQKIYYDMLNAFQLITMNEESKETPTNNIEKIENKKDQQAESAFTPYENVDFRNFSDFCNKTRREIYPNPVF